MKTRSRVIAAGATVLLLGSIGTSAAVASGTDVNPLPGSLLGEAEKGLQDIDDDDADRADDRDADDRPLSPAEQRRLTEGALAEVRNGTVTEIGAEDDNGVAYEVEVTRGDGSEVEVYFDSDFALVAADDDLDDDLDDADDADDADDSDRDD